MLLSSVSFRSPILLLIFHYDGQFRFFLDINDIIMAISFPNLSILVPWLGILIVLFHYLVPYFWINRHLRAIPAPFPAQFTNLWLMYVCRKSRRSDTVYELHQRLGPVVRIQPNHVSIANEEAINFVYGHGKGLEKSYVNSAQYLEQPLRTCRDWYDASISITRSIFTARKRAEHARKRRYIAHSFAPKSARAAEPSVANMVGILIRKWDQIIEECHSEFAEIDCRRWFT